MKRVLIIAALLFAASSPCRADAPGNVATCAPDKTAKFQWDDIRPGMAFIISGTIIWYIGPSAIDKDMRFFEGADFKAELIVYPNHNLVRMPQFDNGGSIRFGKQWWEE